MRQWAYRFQVRLCRLKPRYILSSHKLYTCIGQQINTEQHRHTKRWARMHTTLWPSAAHHPDDNLNIFWYAIEFHKIIQSCLLADDFCIDIHIQIYWHLTLCVCTCSVYIQIDYNFQYSYRPLSRRNWIKSYKIRLRLRIFDRVVYWISIHTYNLIIFAYLT